MAYEKRPYKKGNWHKKDSNAKKPNRGKLSTLMTEEQKQSSTIQDLTYDFACRITRLFQYLTEDSEYKEYVISKQLLRSGTSIAANTAEAQHAQSKSDFLAKMTISSKEANETHFWLRLLHDNGYLEDKAFDSLMTDCLRVRNKIRAITKTTHENIQTDKNTTAHNK